MSKYNTKAIWEKSFGKRETVRDYAGRVMKKSACGNPNSKFFPTIDHIRPLSKGGEDVLSNIIICHCDTNREKADRFPHWKAGGKHFRAERIKGSKVGYEIVEEWEDE